MDESVERPSKRMPLVLEVRYASVPEFLIDYSENLSKEGIFIQSDSPLPMETKIELAIQVPEGPLLEIAGIVVHVLDAQRAAAMGRKPGMGIQFTQYLGTSKEELTLYFKMLK